MDPRELPIAATRVVAQDELAAVGDEQAEALQRIVRDAVEHADYVQPARAEQERARLAAAAALTYASGHRGVTVDERYVLAGC